MRKHQEHNYLHESQNERKGEENLYEDIMTQHFPHLEKETGRHIQEALKVPNKMNLRKPTPICNINCQKLKDRLFEEEKTTSYLQGNPYKTISIFSSRKNTERRGMIHLKTVNQEYSAWQSYHSELKEI